MRSTRTGHRWAAAMVAAILMMLAAAIAAPAQTFHTLTSFDSANGALPYSGLVQATDGNLYGTTVQGGSNVYFGTVFKITPSGALTTVYQFCTQGGCADGAGPYGGLVQSTNGDFYGTTFGGGVVGGFGTVFKLASNGTLTTLHSFCAQSGCPDGANPYAGLAQAANGNFFGVTPFGGLSGKCSGGCGTIFEITPSGTLTTIHNFDSTDGSSPGSVLIQATDGNLYGTTGQGGGNTAACYYGCGTVFRITLTGTLKPLHIFALTDGYDPGPLVQGADGNFYGLRTRAGPTVLALCSKSPQTGHLRPFTTSAPKSTAPTAATPLGEWYRPPTGTFTGQRAAVGQAATA
jgi:uncharacterized repeat protein (TIGR03803 family)